MSSSSSISSKKPPHLLHVNTAATTPNGSAASPVSGSSSHPSPSPSAAGSISGGSGQNQACAACKYQRRKCNPDCPLARYFPADQQRRFLNAHRLFGVSNIQKTLRRIDPEYGPEAMRALIFQSEARAADPVYGCVGIIKRFELEIQAGKAELDALLHQIAIYRQAVAGGEPLADPAAMLVPAAAPGQRNAAMTMDALYGGAPEADAGFAVFHDQQVYNAALKVDDQDQHAPLPLYDYFCYDGTAGDEATSHDATVQEYSYPDANVKQTGSLPVMTTLGEQLENHCQIEAAPLVDAFDVKPQDLPVTIMEHQSHGGGVEQPEQKVAAVVCKYDGADQEMAEPAPAAAQCHLELGFSSF